MAEENKSGGPMPSASQVLKEQQNILNLLKEQTKTAQGPRSLYEHLSETLNHLVMYYPDQALQRLEEVSYLLKKRDTIAIEEFLKINDTRSYAAPNKAVAKATSKQIEQLQTWFPKPVVSTDPDQEAGEPEVAACGFIPDFMSDNKHLYPWAGISFGEYGGLIIQKSLRALTQKTAATNMRFWGKITGTKADYFIAEGTADAGEIAEGAEDQEKPGEGVNMYKYWVTNAPESNQWVMLPDLMAEDISSARSTKVQFTGNLEEKIYTNPFIFKTEKFLLRAQIARIYFSTMLVPKGVYRLQEESTTEVEENAQEDDAPTPVPSTIEMGKKENWCHYTKNVLKCGRITHKEVEPVEEEDPEELKKQQEARDPYENRLRTIKLDKSVVGGMPAWVVRTHGDTDFYANANPAHKILQEYSTVTCKSLLWPGAVTFFSRARWTQIYVGDGQKHESKTYYPVAPPKMCTDPEERTVNEEPNPTEAFLKAKEAAEAAALAAQQAQDQ